MNRFGAWLRIHREAAGLSQEELGEKAGVSQKQVSRIENGDTEPRLPDALALADAVGGSLADALGITGERDAAAIEAAAIVAGLRPDQQRLALALLRTVRDESSG